MSNWHRTVDGMLHMATANELDDAVLGPYPEFARMRAEGAVHARGNGGSSETLGHDVIALGFDEAQTVLRDGETFASDVYGLLDHVMGRTILQMDGREHRTYRGLVQQAFSRASVARWDEEIIGPAVDAAIDRIAGRGRADLVQDLTFPVPFSVIAGMMDLPVDQLDDLHDFSIDLISAAADEQRAVSAAQRLRGTLGEIVTERRRTKGDDIISALAHARGPGRRLTDDEILSFLFLLLPAGGETSFRSTSTLLWALLDQPERLERVRDDDQAFAAAIEEGLRWEPPVVSISRVAQRDTRLADVDVPVGSTVAACVGAANRDERYWTDGDVFDMDRTSRPILTFGTGPHLCLGLHLVRSESVRMVRRLLERCPNLRRDPDAEWQPVTGFLLRSPRTLPVLFD